MIWARWCHSHRSSTNRDLRHINLSTLSLGPILHSSQGSANSPLIWTGYYTRPLLLSIIISHILFITWTCPHWASDQYFTHSQGSKNSPLIWTGYYTRPLLFSIIISYTLFMTLTCPRWTSDQYFTHLKSRQIVPLYGLGIIQGHCFFPSLFPTFYSSHEPVHTEPWSNNSIISRLSEQYPWMAWLSYKATTFSLYYLSLFSFIIFPIY